MVYTCACTCVCEELNSHTLEAGVSVTSALFVFVSEHLCMSKDPSGQTHVGETQWGMRCVCVKGVIRALIMAAAQQHLTDCVCCSEQTFSPHHLHPSPNILSSQAVPIWLMLSISPLRGWQAHMCLCMHLGLTVQPLCTYNTISHTSK